MAMKTKICWYNRKKHRNGKPEKKNEKMRKETKKKQSAKKRNENELKTKLSTLRFGFLDFCRAL